MKKKSLGQIVNRTARTTSTLKIPAALDSYYKMRCKNLGSRRAYLHFLVCTFLSDIKKFQKSADKKLMPGWKKQYQNQGNNLRSRNLEANPEDWELLRAGSLALGVSMCLLFVLLMEQERSQFLKKINRKMDASEMWNSTSPNTLFTGLTFCVVRVLHPERGKMYRKLKILNK